MIKLYIDNQYITDLHCNMRENPQRVVYDYCKMLNISHRGASWFVMRAGK